MATQATPMEGIIAHTPGMAGFCFIALTSSTANYRAEDSLKPRHQHYDNTPERAVSQARDGISIFCTQHRNLARLD